MADPVEVLSSIATKEAYLDLVPKFERETGHTVTTTWAGTVDIMKRMAAGEVHDLVIISSTELDELIRQGKIATGSRVDIAKSGIGVAVRSGAPRPDIGSAEALKRALLAAKTVGYTSGPIMSTPLMWTSSLTCWKPSSHSPLATRVPMVPPEGTLRNLGLISAAIPIRSISWPM